MDTKASAFQVYQRQKRNRSIDEENNGVAKKKIRKIPKEIIEKKLLKVPIVEEPGRLVKLKRKITSPKNEDVNKIPSKLKNKNTEKSKPKKLKKNKTTEKNIKAKNVIIWSSEDEEIPQLVPIHNLNKANHNNKEEIIQEEKNFKTFFNNGNFNKANPEIAPFNSVTQGLAIFKWLIYPTTPKEFFEKYWEKDVMLSKRFDNGYFKSVLSTEKIDSILREFPLNFTRNVDVVHYQNGKKEVIEEEGRALPSKLWDYYSNGCSIRILNPQSYDKNVHSIISALQEYFGTMVGTNVYLTPPHSQGFAPHFDDIEAFIVQLEGSKYWKLYKPKENDILTRESSKNFRPEELGKPFLEVNLNAGDILYFPRGTIHEGRTNDEHSLHITISVYQHTAFIDLLEIAVPEALKKAANENIEFRKGLPMNYLKHVGLVNRNSSSANRKLILDKVKSLLNNLGNYLDVDGAADQLGRKFMHDSMPPLCTPLEAQFSCRMDGEFMKNGAVFNRVEFSPEVKIRLLKYYAIRLVQENDLISKLYYCTENSKIYHGEDEQWLEINNSSIPAIEMLQKIYPEFIEVSQLPINGEFEKLSLVSALWEHGLLITEEPLPNCDSDENESLASSSISDVDDIPISD